jgi:peptide/nickel transport system substrate-binding protein
MALVALVTLALLALAPATAWSQPRPTPRPGGVLNGVLPEDLAQGFAMHETATISTVWPSMPCFSNLVLFDPLKPIESVDTVIGELAERWSWQDNYRNLVFFLRRGVKWHDGQPFTARDVKYTFDMVREAPGTTARLRINPRKDWYANVDTIEVADAHTVIFHLKRPQPSLLVMLASGYSPVYPAHIPAADFRTRCVGTGPFKLKEWRRGEFVEYVRNPDYFIPGRPYLDGIKHTVITERGTRYAALQAGRVDIAFPEGPKALVEQMRQAVPKMVVTPVAASVADNLLYNTTRPPFDNATVRRAISMGIDRRAFIQAVHQGAAFLGTSMSTPPHGLWGLVVKDLEQLPGYRDPRTDKEAARKLLAQAGFTPATPLRVEMATRAISWYLDFASFVVSELKALGVDATLKQVETAQWHPLITRKEFQIAANLTGHAIDDPDATFYENYACGSPRNYTAYCDERTMALIDRQSQELDPKKRLSLVRDVQRQLEEAAPRPIMGWRINYYAQWPHVKNLVPHNSIFNYGRMQEVWLDR